MAYLPLLPAGDACIDVIANPVSARDIRRIVANAGNLQITDRVNIDIRLLQAARAAGVWRWRPATGCCALPPPPDRRGRRGCGLPWAEVAGIRVRYARRPRRRCARALSARLRRRPRQLLFNLDAVAESSPVIALDLPGHGQSDAKLPGTSLAALADFAAKFLDQLDIERVHWVGHSMGGAIGAMFALQYPRRVASLALIASAGAGRR